MNLKEFIAAINPFLKSKGFKKKGENFFLFKERNCMVLNFQKSKGGSVPMFTVNLGISYAVIRDFYGANNLDAIEIDDCHLKQRIGHLLPESRDVWWPLDGSISERELLSLIEYSIECFILNKYIDMMNLNSIVSVWITGKSPGLTDFERYCNLLIVLKYLKDSRFESVLIDFSNFSKAKGFLSSVNIVTNELDMYYKNK